MKHYLGMDLTGLCKSTFQAFMLFFLMFDRSSGVSKIKTIVKCAEYNRMSFLSVKVTVLLWQCIKDKNKLK